MKEVRKFEINMSDNAVIAAEKEEDYVVVDDKIEQMHLTKAENEVINCYMSGLGHCEIATILGINRTTVRRRRERVRGKFNNAFVSD